MYDLTKIDIPMDECPYPEKDDWVLRTLWKGGFVDALNGVIRANVRIDEPKWFQARHEGWLVGSKTSWEELGLEPQISENAIQDEAYKKDVSWSATYLVRSSKDADDATASMRRAFEKCPNAEFIVTAEKIRDPIIPIPGEED